MREISLTIFKILLLAAAYFIAGKLSLLLSIPPGFATPVWPAAGIALAGILIYGYRCLPGVFLGSFATNMLIASNAGAPLTILTPYIVGGGIALGALLQAALGAYLVKRVLVIPTSLSKLGNVTSLLVLGGLIGCLVNASLGPLVLLIAGFIPGSVYLMNALTWWVGDVIGVMLFTPMLLLVANSAISKLRKMVVALPILVFAALAIFIFFNTKDEQQNSRQVDFDKVAQDIAAKLEKDVQIYLNILTANEQFINASTNVSHKEFEAFTSKFLEQQPSILSLSWNSKVTDEGRMAHEEKIRKQGFPDYVIKDRFGVGKIEPAVRRKVYFPVTYLAPYRKNEAAHGFDTYGPDEITDNIRQKVLNQARDEARPIATGRISVVQAEGQYGLLIYHPVYDNALKNGSVTSRREHLIGYTAGVFVMPMMMNSIAKSADEAGMQIVLRDMDAQEDRQLLYDSRTENHQESPETIAPASGAAQSFIKLDVAGHRWELQFIQKAEGIVADQSWDLWYLLIGGLLFSGVFGVFLLGISSNMESIRNELKEEEEEEEEEEGEGIDLNFLVVTKIAGGISTLLGVVVLAGWYTHNTTLIQVHASFVPMQYNTALGFLMCGVGVGALVLERIKLALVCGLIVGIIGVLTLIQYIFGVDFGIDQLLMEHYVTDKTSHPGRMAPNTALCFSLVGIILTTQFFLRTLPYKYSFLRIIGSLVLVLGAVAFVGYLAALETAYGWMNLTRMAVHTAFGFIVLGAGIIAYTWLNVRLYWGATSAMWLPGLAAAIVMLFSIALWQNFKKQQQEIINITLEEELRSVAENISGNMTNSAAALMRMAKRWESHGRPIKEEWLVDAKNYVNDFATLTTVEWIDNTFHVRWIEPLEGNEKAVGLNIVFNEERRKALEGAAEKYTTTLTPPIDLVQGYRAVLSYAPIHIDNRFGGFILGIHKIDILFRDILSSDSFKHLNIQIADGDKEVFSNIADNKYKKEWGLTKTISLLGREWNIAIWPKEEFLIKHGSALPEVALLVGILFSVLIGAAIYHATISSQRSKLLGKKGMALKESETRLSAVIDNIVDGIITIDDRGNIQSFNNACEIIFGYTSEEVIGQNIKMLMPEPYHGEHDGYLKNYRNAGKKKIIGIGREVEGQRKDGVTFSIDLSVSEVIIQGERLFSGIVRDITERKEAEKERDQLMEKLSESNDELSKFAYVASHDLQEPLRMVRNFTQLLEKEYGDKLDDKAKKYINISSTSAERMQNLVQDLLEYARINEEAEALEEIDCNTTVNIVKENLGESIHETKTEITFDTLPVIYGNPIRFSRVVQNLVGNGIKYQKEGNKPKIHISVEDKKTQWQFCIKDNGIGIKPEYCDKIFLPFQRLHKKNEYAGTGIGLAICAKIIEKMGGRIWVESELGKGSKFYFTVPKQKREAKSKHKEKTA